MSTICFCFVSPFVAILLILIVLVCLQVTGWARMGWLRASLWASGWFQCGNGKHSLQAYACHLSACLHFIFIIWFGASLRGFDEPLGLCKHSWVFIWLKAFNPWMRIIVPFRLYVLIMLLNLYFGLGILCHGNTIACNCTKCHGATMQLLDLWFWHFCVNIYCVYEMEKVIMLTRFLLIYAILFVFFLG